MKKKRDDTKDAYIQSVILILSIFAVIIIYFFISELIFNTVNKIEFIDKEHIELNNKIDIKM